MKFLETHLSVKPAPPQYTKSNGSETWTYFTDDIGVGVFGIEFNTDKKVESTWFGRGSVDAEREYTTVDIGYGY